ncbi:MAG: hypothetical protein PHN88_02265 [Ignavibacteria bacterium]|nr:hypothetical protein [Ignavibacteria bacterium]
MKNLSNLLIAFAIILTIAGCSNNQNPIQSIPQSSIQITNNITGTNLIEVMANNNVIIQDTNITKFTIQNGNYDFRFVLVNQYTNFELYLNNVSITKDTTLIIGNL